MSDDRTQSPTRRRRQQARERGQVARSSELTAAVGLLAAVVLLGISGSDLAMALVALVREPFTGDAALSADMAEVIARFRELALSLAMPLGMVIGGVVVAILAAHQVQVGGLWLPGLLAPDPGRLWGQEANAGFSARGRTGAWALPKAAIVIVVAAWAIGSHLSAFDPLSQLETHSLARAAGSLSLDYFYTIALATLGLGLADFALQYRRFESQLRLTPQEQRDDQRADDGDPALRARRRQMAQDFYHDSGRALAGASLVLTGADGLAVVLAGGPPPRRVTVRCFAHGASGLRLRRAADRARIPRVEAHEMARRLARHWAPGIPYSPQFFVELAACWPSNRPAEGSGTAQED